MCVIRRDRQPVLRLLSMAGLVAGLFLGPGDVAQYTGAAPAPSDGKTVRPLPFPDGVIDAQRKVAFVSSPKGGIQAIRLEDGKVHWMNDEAAAQPWLAAGSRLVARGERILVLDAGSGKLLRRCDAPVYPRVDVPERCTVSFNLWDAHATGDVLEARWYAVAHIDRRKGRPFPFAAWTAFNRAVPVGTVKINLGTGRTDVQTDPKRADVTMGLIPRAAEPARRIPAGLPEKLTAVWRRYFKDQQGRITVVNGHLAGVSLTLEQVGRDYWKKVDLHTWSLKTGAAEEPRLLVKDRALALANVMLTLDRRHAAVQFSTSALTLFSLADGKTVARDVKGVFSPESAFVDGMRLYSVVAARDGGRMLRTLDLKSGKPAWERPLQPRSTIPLPP